MDYKTGYTLEKHLSDLRIEKEYIDTDKIDYGLDLGLKKPVRLSWIGINNLTECVGWFDKELENHYPEELSYYLANCCMNPPQTEEDKEEVKIWEEAMKMKKIENQMSTLKFARPIKRRRKPKISKCVAKEFGDFTVKFD
tara:strand:+ start:2357 stop:2776 length:420 start_codon:yes stop_codon:yes gene_type:complete